MMYNKLKRWNDNDNRDNVQQALKRWNDNHNDYNKLKRWNDNRAYVQQA